MKDSAFTVAIMQCIVTQVSFNTYIML